MALANQIMIGTWRGIQFAGGESRHAPAVEPDAATRARLAGLRNPTLRADVQAARALARWLAGEALGCAAQAVRLRADAGGAPGLIGAPGLHLSWSHSGGRVLAACSQAGPVGADVEVMRVPDWRPMLAIVAGRPEAETLLGMPAQEAGAAFLRLWTVKEAVLKALQTGLRSDPRCVCVPAPLLSGAAGEAALDAFGARFAVRVKTHEGHVLALAQAGG